MVTTKRGRRTSRHMLSGTAQSSLDEEVIQRCCTLCAETASRLIETLHENLNTLYRSSGWHSVYCKLAILGPTGHGTITNDDAVCFSAATVLLAACKCPDVAVTVGDPGFERDWARCLYILHHYEDQITSASQAIQVLEVMKQSVSGNGFPSQRKYPQRPQPPSQFPVLIPIHSHSRPAAHPLKYFNAAASKPAAPTTRRPVNYARLLHHANGSARRQSLHAWHGQHERRLVRPAAPEHGLARSEHAAATIMRAFFLLSLSLLACFRTYSCLSSVLDASIQSI